MSSTTARRTARPTSSRPRFPEARVVALPENVGFAAGVNAGIRASGGAYVVALNNDTQAEPGWLEALVTALDGREDVALGASKLLDFTDRDRMETSPATA